MTCNNCLIFFTFYKCNLPLECDCPKCQGLCTCGDIDCDDETLSIDKVPDLLDEIPEGCLPGDEED